jgi:hypothetical protein
MTKEKPRLVLANILASVQQSKLHQTPQVSFHKIHRHVNGVETVDSAADTPSALVPSTIQPD